MNLGIIVAFSENRVIGNEGNLPWRIPEDLKHFRKLTTNHPIIMGRKTYESIGKVLPSRENIVLSNGEVVGEGIVLARSINEALGYVDKMPNQNIDYSKVYFIGGESVYNAALPISNFLEVTMVKGFYEGDRFFPEIGEEWRETKREDFDNFSFVSYERK